MKSSRAIFHALAVIGLCAGWSLSFAAKQTEPTASERLQNQAAEAAQRAAAGTTEPNEINMIKARRIMNGKPGLQMYVILLSKGGQPIDYFVTQGKCTSSQKRLSPTHRLVDTGPNSLVVKAPSEDGTFGSSAPYIYCKTVDGKYKQWNGNYYASDKPIELTIKPLVIDTSGRNQQQQ
jgi:hypothetical protein